MLTPPPNERPSWGKEGWCPPPGIICQRIGDNHLSQTQLQNVLLYGWQFLEIATHACNAPSPNLNLSSALSTTVTVCSSPICSISVNISISFVAVLILGRVLV